MGPSWCLVYVVSEGLRGFYYLLKNRQKTKNNDPYITLIRKSLFSSWWVVKQLVGLRPVQPHQASLLVLLDGHSLPLERTNVQVVPGKLTERHATSAQKLGWECCFS